MGLTSLYVYLAVSVLLVFGVLYCAVRLIQRGKSSRWLAVVCFLVILCTVSYFARAFSTSITMYSWMTTVHLLCDTLALLGFLSFTCAYTEYGNNRIVKTFMLILSVAAFINCVVILSNPFTHFVVDFRFRTEGDYGFGYPYSIIKYSTQYWFYYVNVAIDYISALGIIVLLLKKTFAVPREFRSQYAYAAIAIVLVIFANALSIFLFKNDGLLNYSVGFYGLMSIFLYQYAYDYSDRMKLNLFKTSVFENVGQGLVLFDYGGKMILCNEKAKGMLPAVNFNGGVTLEKFKHECNITFEENEKLDETSVQCYVFTETGIIPLRCDYRRIKGDKGRCLGSLFAFTDVQLETDFLTGYHKWESFRNFIRDNENGFSLPMTVVVADINNLAMVNTVAGREAGDKLLKKFADMLRSIFPKDTYFGRGDGASLILLNHNMDMNAIIDAMSYMRAHFEGSFAYANEFVTTENPGILKAINNAENTLKQKKLMDANSSHAKTLDTLLHAMYAADPVLEKESVQMRKWCDQLGRRLNLTAGQQSDLLLLCLLHDVGNIGVPKSILGKPGALTNEEWVYVKLHAERGFAIARSSTEFESIANFILHHHERWDGKGYPKGLCREEIPLLSRIISVVDAYSAMLNARPHRPAMSKEIAISELRACAGTQFDPAIVREFLKIVVTENEPQEKAATVKMPAVPQAARESTNREAQQNVSLVEHCRFITDMRMYILSVDEKFEFFTGYSREDIREHGLNIQKLIPPEELTEYLCVMTEDITEKKTTFIKHHLLRKDGVRVNVVVYGRQYYDSAARADRTEVIMAYAPSLNATAVSATSGSEPT